jgi:hypothetical protein
MKQVAEYIIPIIQDGKNCVPDFLQAKELIRCKDCIYYDGHYCHNKWWGDGYGDYTSPIKKEDGHCDWAERREE